MLGLKKVLEMKIDKFRVIEIDDARVGVIHGIDDVDIGFVRWRDENMLMVRCIDCIYVYLPKEDALYRFDDSEVCKG
jgi:hypothetical protein